MHALCTLRNCKREQEMQFFEMQFCLVIFDTACVHKVHTTHHKDTEVHFSNLKKFRGQFVGYLSVYYEKKVTQSPNMKASSV